MHLFPNQILSEAYLSMTGFDEFEHLFCTGVSCPWRASSAPRFFICSVIRRDWRCSVQTAQCSNERFSYFSAQEACMWEETLMRNGSDNLNIFNWQLTEEIDSVWNISMGVSNFKWFSLLRNWQREERTAENASLGPPIDNTFWTPKPWIS